MPNKTLHRSVKFWSKLWTWYAVFGAIVWGFTAALVPFDDLRSFGYIVYALILAPLVIVPLALSMVATPLRWGGVSKWYWLPAIIHPVAVALALVALTLPQGNFAAVLAIPYLFETVTLSLFGFSRLAIRGFKPIEELCVDIGGFFYLMVAGAWWLATCAGWSLGYSPLIVELTAVHFHFAGFAVAIITGFMGRSIPRSAHFVRFCYQIVALTAVICPIFVGFGIAFSPILEVTAVTIFVLSMIVLGIILAFYIAPKQQNHISALLLTISGLALLMPMVLALLYGIGEVRGVDNIDLRIMAYAHGLLNAFGFALCGLLGWRLLPPTTRCVPPNPPFSRLTANGLHVGADYFDRNGLVDDSHPVSGFVADLSAYNSASFHSEFVDPTIRLFYENTNQFKLNVHAKWSKGFRLAGRLFRRLAKIMGQLNLPLDSVLDSEMQSRLFAINSASDGRESVRVWVRTYKASNEPVYVAAYSIHHYENIPYMNIAFPLPGGNLTSILRMVSVPNETGALQLTTLPVGEQNGDEGVYFANRFMPMRLPFDETITVWPHAPKDQLQENSSDHPNTIFARHDLWLFGIHYLHIDYSLVLQPHED